MLETLCLRFTAVLVAVAVVPVGSVAAQRRGPTPRNVVLLAHEIIRGVAVRDGLAEALPRYFLDDAALLWPGLPIVTGRERIGQVLGAQGILPGTELDLKPLRLLASDDGSAVLTWGTARWANPDTTRPATGRYLAAWHRTETAWRLGALAVVNLLGNGVPGWPEGLEAPRGGEPVLLSSGRGRPFAVADLAFADSAFRASGSSAFGHWAAPGGVTFDEAGLVSIGPAEISRSVSGLDGAEWRWAPVAAGASEDGTLGWTAGEATITLPATEEEPARELRRTYLTLWQRQPDGSIKFIADGGGTRP